MDKETSGSTIRILDSILIKIEFIHPNAWNP